MTHLAALEASSRVTTVFGGASAAVRDFHTNLVAHEVALVVLCNALFRRLAVIELLQRAKEELLLLEPGAALKNGPLTTKPYPTLFARRTAHLVSMTSSATERR